MQNGITFIWGVTSVSPEQAGTTGNIAYSETLSLNLPISINTGATALSGIADGQSIISNFNFDQSRITFRLLRSNAITSPVNVSFIIIAEALTANTQSTDNPDDQTEAGPVEEIEP